MVVLERANWLPSASLIAAVTLFFWHVLLRPTSAWVGDACSIDFQGTLQQLWLLRFHHFDLSELSGTVYMTYPTPVNLLSELGFLLDIGLLAGTQALFGSVLGYNVGAWLILVGLALAIYHCARRFEISPWFAAIAGILAVSAGPVADEVSSGRFYQIFSLATAIACLAEWPQLKAGSRWAAIRTGGWLTVTVLAHAFTGQLIAVFLFCTALVTLARADKTQRVPLSLQYALAAGATLLLAVGPVLLQMANLPSGEEGIGMLSGYEAYYLRVFQSAELHGLSPLQLVRQGILRIVPLGLAGAALLVRNRRGTALLFAALFVGSLFVVWGPYHYAVMTPPGGGDPVAFDIPLPYLALRAILPYFWRLLWLKRVVLFANVAVGILAAMTLAWAYHALPVRRIWARLLVALAVAITFAQPLTEGYLPLTHSLVVEETDGGAEAAALLERVRLSTDVKVVVSIARALHLQERFQKPVSAPKWTYYVSCDNRTLYNCGRFFDSFVEMRSHLPATERIRLGLCHLERAGTTHLLFFPRRFIARATFGEDGADEALVEARQEEILGVLKGLANLIDEGGGIQLYELRRCKESPKARGSGLPKK